MIHLLPQVAPVGGPAINGSLASLLSLEGSLTFYSLSQKKNSLSIAPIWFPETLSMASFIVKNLNFKKIKYSLFSSISKIVRRIKKIFINYKKGKKLTKLTLGRKEFRN